MRHYETMQLARQLAKAKTKEIKSDVQKSDYDNRYIDDDLYACMTSLPAHKARNSK